MAHSLDDPNPLHQQLLHEISILCSDDHFWLWEIQSEVEHRLSREAAPQSDRSERSARLLAETILRELAERDYVSFFWNAWASEHFEPEATEVALTLLSDDRVRDVDQSVGRYLVVTATDAGERYSRDLVHTG